MLVRNSAGMIMSVSTFSMGRGTALPESVAAALSAPMSEVPLARDDAALDRAGGHGGRRGQVREAAGALASHEVPVGGAEAALAGGNLVVVHPEAHGAARHAQLRARRREDFVQTLGLGLRQHGLRAGDDVQR